MTFPTSPQAASAENSAAIATRKLHPLVDLQCDRSWFDELQGRMTKGGPWDDWTLFQLALEAEHAKRLKALSNCYVCDHCLPSSLWHIKSAPRARSCMKWEVELF